MIKLFRWKLASYNMNVKHLYTSATALSVKSNFICYEVMIPTLWYLCLTISRQILLWLTLVWRFANCLRFSQEAILCGACSLYKGRDHKEKKGESI